jgi:hypothetical protein
MFFMKRVKLLSSSSLQKFPERFQHIPINRLSQLRYSYQKNNEIKKHFDLGIQVHTPFKWHRLESKFHGVFSGTTDRLTDHTPKLEQIIEYVNNVATCARVNLVSVIGGNFYLELLEKIDPDKLILFDNNILEIVKTGYFLSNLSSADPIEATEKSMQEFITESFSNLGESKLEFEMLSGSKWTHLGIQSTSFPILLNQKDFPRHAAFRNKLEWQEAKTRISKSLCREIWLDLPRINLEKNFTVVFVSNCVESELSDLDIRTRLINPSGLVIIRSNDAGDKPNINDGCLNPHEYWRAVLYSILDTVDGCKKTLQIFPSELRHIFDYNYQIEHRNYDVFDTEGSAVLGDCNLDNFAGFNILVTHILLGKLQNFNSLESRLSEIANLFSTIPTEISRIIISEFHPKSKRFGHLSKKFTSLEMLCASYSEILGGRFKLSQIRTSPGLGELERNVFLVFEKL